MRRSLPLLSSLVLAALLAPAGADAAFFPGTPIAGPGNDLVAVGDVTVSRAGDGAATALVRDGGVAHAFLTPLVDGAFGPLQRLDGAYATPATTPVVAGADGGRLLAVWATGGQVVAAVKLGDAVGFSAPQALGAGSSPAVDMSLNGAAYVSFTAPGGGGTDVRVARLPRGTTTTTLDVLPDPVDVDANQAAGDGDRRSRIATSADGTAVVTWGESGGDGRTHVYARRLFGERPSSSPQDVTVDAVDGHASVGGASLPDIDIEDDSSFAWITFRQGLDDGHQRILARRLVGSAFDPPVLVDGLGYPAASDAAEVVMQENGEGEGMAVSAGAGGVFSAVLHDNLFNPAVAVGSAATPSSPAAGLGENGLGLIAWVAADANVHARPYKYVESSRAVPTPQPDALLSDPALGPVTAALGMDLEVNRAGDAAAVFAQTAGDGIRLVGAYFDRPPGAFRGLSTTKPRQSATPTLAWSSAFELWGAISYQVLVDGQPVGAPTGGLKLQIPAIPDGRHQWSVRATDERGQVTESAARALVIDKTKPTLTVSVATKGKLVKVSARALDGTGGSGIARVRIDFGDGTISNTSTSSHRYASGGKRTIRVSATDKAGNAVAVTKAITVAK